MKKISKTLLTTALTAVIVVGSTNAMATNLPFSILDPISSATFYNLGSIGGSYQEVVTFGASNTFDTSLLWNATGLANTNNANVGGSSQYLNFGYGLYAVYQASGTYSTVAGVTTFTFTPGGSLNLYLDIYGDGDLYKTTFGSPPADGSTAWSLGNNGTDILIASGSTTQGSGLLSCGNAGNNDCGSFGVTTGFNLTAAGKDYFTSPDPFYQFSIEAGNFNFFDVAPSTTQNDIHGVANVVFVNVPEPESLALMGVGMLGLVFARRGRKQA